MEIAAGVKAGGFQGEPLLAGAEDIGQGGLTTFLQLVEAVFEGFRLGQEFGGGFLMNGRERFRFIQRGSGFERRSDRQQRAAVSVLVASAERTGKPEGLPLVGEKSAFPAAGGGHAWRD